MIISHSNSSTGETEPFDEVLPLVAICMTTYNPPPELFSRQIESISNQTYQRWICVISDDNSHPDILSHIRNTIAQDKRFILHAPQARLGFYRNFERCLRLAPKEAQLIALSDQDDYWHSDKLEVLTASLKNGSSLVYSDMNIVDVENRLLASTYWTERPNNYTNFASLILANTVTGAASLFPRWLLEYALPFPEKIGEIYHDHWIACVALALGEIGYVDRPLYDYVQHQSNVIGHFIPVKENFVKKFFKLLTNPRHLKQNIARNLGQWRSIYFWDLLRLQVIAQVIEMRCEERLTEEKRKILQRIAHLDDSLLSQTWLTLRSLKNLGRTSETIGAENSLLRGLIWKKYMKLKSLIPIGGQPNAGAVTNSAVSQSGKTAASSAGVGRIEIIQQKTAPLSLRILSVAAERINLLIPAIDFKYLFGGYITKLNLARCLAESGARVRIVIVDKCDYLPAVWRQQLRAYDGIERLLDQVDIACCFDRSQPLEVSPNDSFIATTWWTAHIARQAVLDMSKSKFVYLIQEYEPFTFEMGSFAALATETYTFPHYAVFSTELLREYFRENRLGVFSESTEAGDSNSISFQNTITSVGQVGKEALTRRQIRRLLFYARPEAHASRNMFELAVIALSSAVKAGHFKGEWEFHGIGTVGGASRIKLSNDVFLKLLPRQNQDDYRSVLRAHDLGLSLMYTPHPSLVPIEMAGAGMLVVTNTYANKTRAKMEAISTNIVAVDPTVEAVVKGLKEASENIEDYDRRVRGSKINWATSWEAAFNTVVMTRIKEFISASRS